MQQMDKRFEQVDKRFEAMQQSIDKRFEQVDKRFEAMAAKHGQKVFDVAMVYSNKHWSSYRYLGLA